MINVNNKNTMQRQEHVIQLSDHVKNKLKQHQNPPIISPFINSSDEFIQVNSTEDEDELDSTRLTTPDNVTRPRRDTYTIYQVKQSSGAFFTDRKPRNNDSISFLQDKYKKQQICQECLRRERIIDLERQDLLRLYKQNKELTNQLRSTILLNHQYKDDIQNLKSHLTKVNSHLYEYQINFDHLKQKISSDKKTIIPKKDDEQEQEQDVTIDHIKRLRYEIQMYNRIVAARENQERKIEQKQIQFLF